MLLAERQAYGARVRDQALLIEQLKHQIARLRHERFGQSSERRALLDQLELQLFELKEDQAQAEAATPLDVTTEPEALESGKIVRRHRGGGERRVFTGRDESPVMPALKGEDAVGEEVRGLRPLAKAFGQCAKILADDCAAVPLAFECNESEQRLERIIDVGAPGRRAAARNPVEPAQTHDMVDPQNACVPHVGAQRRDDRGKAAAAQHERVYRRQTPILSGAAERIGWSADRSARRDQLLVRPGLGTVLIDPNGEVTVEPNCQPASASGCRRLA